MILTREDAKAQGYETFRLADELREQTVCKGCKQEKNIGTVLCWDCYKYRKDSYKYSGLEIADWLNKINKIERNQ